jgi:hypothetical protein
MEVSLGGGHNETIECGRSDESVQQRGKEVYTA